MKQLATVAVVAPSDDSAGSESKSCSHHLTTHRSKTHPSTWYHPEMKADDLVLENCSNELESDRKILELRRQVIGRRDEDSGKSSWRFFTSNWISLDGNKRVSKKFHVNHEYIEMLQLKKNLTIDRQKTFIEMRFWILLAQFNYRFPQAAGCWLSVDEESSLLVPQKTPIMQLLPFRFIRSARCCFIDSYDTFFMSQIFFPCFLTIVHILMRWCSFSQLATVRFFSCSQYGHVVEQHFFPSNSDLDSSFSCSLAAQKHRRDSCGKSHAVSGFLRDLWAPRKTWN